MDQSVILDVNKRKQPNQLYLDDRHCMYYTTHLVRVDH
jgi:hypothetical protein